MAEFAVLPKTYLDGEISEEKNAFMFVVSNLFSEDTDTSKQLDFRDAYDNINKAALDSPCFALDRNQDFEHKASMSASECHRHIDSFITKELQTFLPSFDPEWLGLQAKAALEKISLDHGPGGSDADGQTQSETVSAAGSNPADSTSQESQGILSTIVRCRPVPNDPQTHVHGGKSIEMCFVFLPQLDKFQIEVHYLEIKALQVQHQPTSRWFAQLRGSAKSKDEVQLQGTRSFARFSMLTPTTVAVMKTLESQKYDTTKAARNFFEKANKVEKSLLRSVPNSEPPKPGLPPHNHPNTEGDANAPSEYLKSKK